MNGHTEKCGKPVDLTCRDAYAFLDDYVEGRLASEVRGAFDEHLAECSSCRRYMAQYEAVVAAMRWSDSAASHVPSIPAGLLGAIRSLRPVA
jgi:anti-sigma factor RsiW